MPDITKIIASLDKWIETHNVSYFEPAEANDILDNAGLLKERPNKRGKYLRDLLRKGDLPHAYKEGGQWRIPHSNGNVIPSEPKAKPTVRKSVLPKAVTPSANDIQCFPPLIDESSEILVLGTAPGTESLRIGQYYTSNRNSFWKIISHIFNSGVPFTSYQEKTECLRRNHIALWDVFSSCLRDGSADNKIENDGRYYNDIEGLLKQYPSIRKIVLNGKEAAEGFRSSVASVKACSTSNTNTHMTYEEKQEAWKEYLK